jgi:serine-type D-Ala-D-Ala carboxypeptidase (penicillin-binding protein 5/6)
MRYSKFGPLWLLCLTTCLSALSPAQDSSPSNDGRAAAGVDRIEPAGAPEAAVSGESRHGAGESSKSPEQIRIEMLERLADQLSRRMRTLKEREAALAARENALIEREKTAKEREENVSLMEEMMELREDVVKRREKLPPPQSWNGPPAPSIFGQYAAVLDGATMQFYHKKDAEARVPVASTQKLVTAIVICQDGDLDGLVEVPSEVLRIEPTLVGVKPGERYSRRQMLTALLVKSGNDIAATLAIDNAGSVEAFARKMNACARSIGMTNSHFINPHGLPAEGQYSTARDIAVAAFEAYQIPDIRAMVEAKTYDFVFNDGTVKTLLNTNRLLDDFEGCNGMKTGFTFAAGNCLVSSVSIDGKDRISVVLKSARAHVSQDSAALLNWSLGLRMLGPAGDSFAVNK